MVRQSRALLFEKDYHNLFNFVKLFIFNSYYQGHSSSRHLCCWLVEFK